MSVFQFLPNISGHVALYSLAVMPPRHIISILRFIMINLSLVLNQNFNCTVLTQLSFWHMEAAVLITSFVQWPDVLWCEECIINLILHYFSHMFFFHWNFREENLFLFLFSHLFFPLLPNTFSWIIYIPTIFLHSSKLGVLRNCLFGRVILIFM